MYLKVTTLLVSLLYFAVLAMLLNVSMPPKFPGWVQPLHFSSSLVFALAIAASLTLWLAKSTLYISWTTNVVGCVLIIMMELMQLLNPNRFFEFKDILEGCAGITAGAILSFILLQFLKKTFLQQETHLLKILNVIYN